MPAYYLSSSISKAPETISCTTANSAPNSQRPGAVGSSPSGIATDYQTSFCRIKATAVPNPDASIFTGRTKTGQIYDAYGQENKTTTLNSHSLASTVKFGLSKI